MTYRNLNRRSYTPSQRAAIAVDMKDRLHEEYKTRQLAGLKRGTEKREARSANLDHTGCKAREDAAAMMKVSAGYITEADRIREAAPAVFEAVKSGEATIPDAKRIMADPETFAAVQAREITVPQAKERIQAKRAPQVHEAPPEPSIEEVVGRLAADLVRPRSIRETSVERRGRLCRRAGGSPPGIAQVTIDDC